MPERDANKEALEQVEKITESEKATDSDPISGEELLESPELKKLLRDAKDKAKSESREPLSE